MADNRAYAITGEALINTAEKLEKLKKPQDVSQQGNLYALHIQAYSKIIHFNLGDLQLHTLPVEEILKTPPPPSQNLTTPGVINCCILGNKDSHSFLQRYARPLGFTYLETGLHSINGQSVAVIGGIYNEKYYKAKSWDLDPNERIYFTEDQLRNIYDKMSNERVGIDIVLTHQGASKVLPRHLANKGSDELNLFLGNVRPKLYIYGHHNINHKRVFSNLPSTLHFWGVPTNSYQKTFGVGVGKWRSGKNVIHLNEFGRIIY